MNRIMIMAGKINLVKLLFFCSNIFCVRIVSPIEPKIIITIDANELLKPIHARMPLIISQEHYATWLNHDSYALDSLQSLLSPYSPENM